MAQKIRYAILDDVEQIVVVTEDGSLATAHFNDEFIVVNWYGNNILTQLNNNNFDETIWKYLDEGIRYWKEFHEKQEIDIEVIEFMLEKLYGALQYEKDEEVECFCEEDLRIVFSKN